MKKELKILEVVTTFEGETNGLFVLQKGNKSLILEASDIQVKNPIKWLKDKLKSKTLEELSEYSGQFLEVVELNKKVTLKSKAQEIISDWNQYYGGEEIKIEKEILHIV